MSHNYYNELWLITRNDLEKLLTLDRRVQEQPDTKNREHGLNLILPTYLRYRNLVKRLIVCHDQMVQTQKRDLIKRVLDCAVGRMLDYKKRIVDLDFTDYQWPDDFMKQLKYTPDDVEITVSAAGKDVVQYRRKRIVQLMENAHKLPETDMEEHTTETEVLTVAESEESAAKFRKRRVKEESAIKVQQSILHVPSEVLAAREARLAAEETMRKAILLIQSHERARMARITGIELERTNAYRRRVETGEIVPKMFSKATYEKAARTIQRAWWTYLRKKAQRKRMGRFEELIGMSIPSWKSDRVLAKDRENFQKKLESMPVCAEHVAKATEDHRTKVYEYFLYPLCTVDYCSPWCINDLALDSKKLWKVKGPGLMEDITDEIREWFVIWYNETGHFDVYPAASLGGTVLVATGQTLTPQEFLAQKVKAKDAKEEPKKGGKGERKKRKRKKPWMPETKAFTLLDEANRDFIGNWSFRRDTDDTGEMIYGDLIKDKLCYELQLEMREIVDELMKLELKKLNQALKKDCKANNKHIDIPKSKGGRKKKKKGRKGKKRDLLGNATVEDIFSELVHANIIEDYPLTSLKGWVGDLSYENYEAAREFRDHRHRLGEIKQVVMENCILPLSSKEIHQIAPMVRSVCICGLPRHGKTFLVNAICSEVGALLINMTPSVLVDKYVGRKNERKLIDMISKVARELAPSVIFIDNSEKLWAKKVPAEERVNKPKRFAKYYPKFVKSIKRGDQILFLTTSSEPYKATRPFVRVHDKFIMIPLTDYNTLYMFYKDLLMRYHGVDRDIDVSCLAKMSEGIPLEFIKQAIENVLNVRRRITLRFEPLNPREIMEEVMKHEPFSKKTLSQFAKFESRTPIATKRARMLMALKAEREKQEQSKKTKK